MTFAENSDNIAKIIFIGFLPDDERCAKIKPIVADIDLIFEGAAGGLKTNSCVDLMDLTDFVERPL